MNHQPKDTDLREALRRRYADTPRLPADFIDRMEQRMTTKARHGTQASHLRRRTLIRMTAAAALAAAATIALTVLLTRPHQVATEHQERTLSRDALQGRPEPLRAEATEQKSQTEILAPPRPRTPAASESILAPPHPRAPAPPRSIPAPPIAVSKPYDAPTADPNLHHAAYTPADDSTRQAPSRVSEFIARLAEYNKVKGVPLDCAADRSDTTVVSMAYVFDDKEELDLFARLLQVACAYDTKTPGYLLNFSRQQFLFTLKDLRKQEKYLWLAERIGSSRILLYCTRSPISATVSSACYQEFREQLTHTNIHLQF